MNNIINCKLISTIFNKKVEQIVTDPKVIRLNLRSDKSDSEIAYRIGTDWYYININELGSNIKRWAYYDSGEYYIIDSNFANKGNAFIKDGNGTHEQYFYADTEAEAICKAGNYILDKLDI